MTGWEVCLDRGDQVVLTALGAASGGSPAFEGPACRRTADCFPVGICARSHPNRVIVSRFWPQEGHPPPAGSPLQLRVTHGGKKDTA